MPAISRLAAVSLQPRSPRRRNVLRSPCRVLQGETVGERAALASQREGVEHANRALVPVEELAEVGLAQPAVDTAARLDAHQLRHRRGSSKAPRQEHLTKPAAAEKALDAVLQPGFRADDELPHLEQSRVSCAARERTGRGVRDVWF